MTNMEKENNEFEQVIAKHITELEKDIAVSSMVELGSDNVTDSTAELGNDNATDPTAESGSDGEDKNNKEEKITVVYANEKPLLSKRSIFLAGPSRINASAKKSWRQKALDILEELGYHGVVYVPEICSDSTIQKVDLQYLNLWSRTVMDQCGCICFYMVRNLSKGVVGVSADIDFGLYMHKRPDKIVFGHPIWADCTGQLDYQYISRKLGRYITSDDLYKYIKFDLKDLLVEAVEMVKDEDDSMFECNIPEIPDSYWSSSTILSDEELIWDEADASEGCISSSIPEMREFLSKLKS